MNILAIDTSTEACSAALLCQDRTASRFEIAAQRHTDLILPMCESLLSEAGLLLEQLDAIAVTRGPGSFTGIRIGVGVCQGIALAHQLDVIQLSTLQVLAQTAHRQTGASKVHCLIDARMQEVYQGCFNLVDNIMMPATEEKLCRPEDINLDTGVTPAGTGWAAYQLADNSDNITSLPNALDMLPAAAQQLQVGATVSALSIEPVYLRNKVAKKPGEK